MLMELSVVEQRYLAVREALDTGAAITDIASRYGVDRRTLHRWLARYAAGGLGALADRSSKPDRCPHQISPEVEARIVALRRAHPDWGLRTIRSRLRRELADPPSRSAIYRCLVRQRLIAPKPRRRRLSDYKRWERHRPMELWQIDVMGGVRLDDGTHLSVVTGIDDHSRFCVIAKIVERATARPVCDALLDALARHGIPEILTDNGKVFTGKLATKPATVAFDRICLNNGIRHLLTAPYSPTTTGKIERLHKTMRKECFADRTFVSIEQAQADLDGWVSHYNHHRDHQAIGDVPPIRRFELAEQRSFEVISGEVELEQPHEQEPKVVGRRVDAAGRISILTHRYHVGRHLAGQRVALESADGLLHVSHNGVVVATHARRHLAEDDDRMDRRSDHTRPARPTRGDEVLRKVDSSGGVSFAGTNYRVGNRYRGQTVGFASSATPCRSPRTTRCFGRTELVTTRAKSSGRWGIRPDDQGRIRMSHRYRSQFEAPVPGPHIYLRFRRLLATGGRRWGRGGAAWGPHVAQVVHALENEKSCRACCSVLLSYAPGAAREPLRGRSEHRRSHSSQTLRLQARRLPPEAQRRKETDRARVAFEDSTARRFRNERHDPLSIPGARRLPPRLLLSGGRHRDHPGTGSFPYGASAWRGGQLALGVA
jgi:transposase InsO family protein